jgi:hypothetical protein
MGLSFFCDKYYIPSECEVSEVLGETTKFWSELKHYLETYGMIREEWKIYSQKSGWCKKLLLATGGEERNMIFMYPNVNYFTGVLVFGEKAVREAELCGIPEEILNKILSAKPYMEGRSFNIEIRGALDFENIKKLITIKIQN